MEAVQTEPITALHNTAHRQERAEDGKRAIAPTTHFQPTDLLLPRRDLKVQRRLGMVRTVLTNVAPGCRTTRLPCPLAMHKTRAHIEPTRVTGHHAGARACRIVTCAGVSQGATAVSQRRQARAGRRAAGNHTAGIHPVDWIDGLEAGLWRGGWRVVGEAPPATSIPVRGETWVVVVSACAAPNPCLCGVAPLVIVCVRFAVMCWLSWRGVCVGRVWRLHRHGVVVRRG